MYIKYGIILAVMAATVANSPVIAAEIVINAVGDIMLAGSAAPTLKKLGYDHPFGGTAEELKKADINIGNLETPIGLGGVEFTGKKFRFRSAPQAAPALKRAGFSVVTLANNHIMDFGEEALQETARNLAENGILYTGAGPSLAAAREPAILERKGARIAFLAYSITLPAEFYASASQAGTAPGHPRYYKNDIALAKRSADYVVVSFHWGSEATTTPHSYQIKAAHAAIDAGADLVLGHHPHVLQGIERYKNGVIFYSLGNFIFGSMSRTASTSIIARITLDKGVKKVEVIPIEIRNRKARFQPKLLTAKEGEDVVDHLERISRKMGTVMVREKNRFFVKGAADDMKFAAIKGGKANDPPVRGH